MTPEAGGDSRAWAGRERAAAALFVGLVSFGVHANTLSNGFVYDDAKQILANPWITDLRFLTDIMKRDVWGFWEERGASPYYRPLMHVLYMITHQAFGLAPWAYHLLNVIFHTANSLLVFFLVERVGRDSGEISSPGVPLVAALLFATHPIHSEAVAWAGGIPDLSFSFFYLLSFWLYLGATREDGGSSLRLLLSLCAFALALLAKEPAVTLPLMLLAHDLSFGLAHVRRNLKKLLAYVVVAGAYFAVRLSVLEGSWLPRAGSPLENWLPDVFALFGRYLGKLLLPIHLNAYYPSSPAGSFFEPAVLLGLGSMVLFAAALYASLGRSKLVFLGLAFIALPLAPALYVPGIGGTPFAERYLYLPSLGFALLVALSISRVAAHMRKPELPVLVAGISIALLYSGGTLARNQVWKDDYRLWSDTVRKSPESGIPRNNLGRAYFSMGDIDKAVEQYRVALRINPAHAEARNNLGAALATKGMVEEAESELLIALKLDPDYSDAHNNIGILYGSRGNLDLAVLHFRKALGVRPDFPDAHHNIGVTYLNQGRVDWAIDHFRATLELKPDAANTHLNLARAYEIKGLGDEARRHRLRAQALAGEKAGS
jgi:tetratricopeptide (TPR) repeat protein